MIISFYNDHKIIFNPDAVRISKLTESNPVASYYTHFFSTICVIHRQTITILTGYNNPRFIITVVDGRRIELIIWLLWV